MITKLLRLAAVGALLASSGAPAQTCSAPIPLVPDSTTYGTTCGASRIAESFCDGTPNPGPNVVYHLTLEHPGVVDFMIGSLSPGFDPTLYVSTGDCIAGGCASAFDPAEPFPAGDYWIVVAASSASPVGSCGSFVIANTVTPSEAIFSDTFD